MIRTTTLIGLCFVLTTTVLRVSGNPKPALDDARWDAPNHTDTVFKPTSYAALPDWLARRAWLCGQVRYAVGLWPEPDKCPLNPVISGKVEQDGVAIEKVYFESYPGFYVTGNLYRPVEHKGKLPAIACPHGHWKQGRLNNDELCSVPARCMTLARLGAVVFAYDMIGYVDHKRFCEHNIDTIPRSLWGISAMSLQTWDSIRVLDFLQSLPEVDPLRIGVTGASGGGTQTFILSAVDDRVKVAAPVCMVSSTMQGGCACENAPTLRIETNNMEIAACFAPKPLLLVSASGDWTSNTPAVEYPMIRKIYELYGFTNRVENAHFDVKHNYNHDSRRAVYRFFGKHLMNRNDADTVTEKPLDDEFVKQLSVFDDGPLPQNALTMEEFEKTLVAAIRKQLDSLKPTTIERAKEVSDIVETGLRHAVNSKWPMMEDIQVLDDTTMPARWHNENHPQQGEVSGVSLATVRYYTRNRRPVRTLRLDPKQSDGQERSLIICVHPDGIAAADTMRHFVELSMGPGGSRSLLFVEPFGTGDKKQPSVEAKDLPTVYDKAFRKNPNMTVMRGKTNFFTTFNRTDTAETVYDIVTVLAALLGKDQPVEKVHLIGFGEMGPCVLLARTFISSYLAEHHAVATFADMQQADIGSDDYYLEHLYLPNIQCIGGLRSAAVSATSSPLWLCNVKDGFPADWAEASARLYKTPLRITHELASDEAIVNWIVQQNINR